MPAITLRWRSGTPFGAGGRAGGMQQHRDIVGLRARHDIGGESAGSAASRARPRRSNISSNDITTSAG